MDFNTPSYIRVTTLAGAVPYLITELQNMGFNTHTDQSLIHVGITGTVFDGIKICKQSRIAHRVLYELKSFNAKHPDELYKNIKNIAWEDIIPHKGYFSIESSVENTYIRDTRFANLRVKDAIADRFASALGTRPDSGPEHTQTLIYVHWRQNTAQVYIDLSGETLARHGYRKNPWKAPLQESLAASLIYATQWDKATHFVNPMCGSGTVAIEAALFACNILPGSYRHNYGYKHLIGYDSETDPFEAAPTDIPDRLPFKIVASDINADAIKAAKSNASEAGVAHLIQFEVCSFEKTTVPDGSGVLFLNPEYGERLGDDRELARMYPSFGDFFKKSCMGYHAFVFTGNLDLAKTIGLKPSAKLDFFNARIACKLFAFEIYAGKKSD